MAATNLSPAHQESWDQLSEKTVQTLRHVRRVRRRIGVTLRGVAGFFLAGAVAFAGYQVTGEKTADATKIVDFLVALGKALSVLAPAGGLVAFFGKAESCNLKLKRVEKEALFGDPASLLKAISGLSCHRSRFDEVYDDARKLRRKLT